jgi:hypothetical protein
MFNQLGDFFALPLSIEKFVNNLSASLPKGPLGCTIMLLEYLALLDNWKTARFNSSR